MGMTTAEVLAACRSSGVSLRLAPDGALRQQGAGPELLAELKLHREELRPVLAARSWPYLGFVGFDLASAVCACGHAPWVFTENGEPRCQACLSKTPFAEPLDKAFESMLI